MYAADFLIQAYSQPEGMTTVTLEGLSAMLSIVTTPLSGEENLKRCANYISGSINKLPGLLLEAWDLLVSRRELLASNRGLIEQGLTREKIAQKLFDKNYTASWGKECG